MRLSLQREREREREMGKIKCESHFSHPHPLTLIPHDQALTSSPSSSSCSGCKLKLSDMVYSCTTCTFSLHQKCFEMPRKISHPFHEDHALTLLPEPVYAGGQFNCDACAELGSGFSYHCEPCSVDLHIHCAAAPLSLQASACHVHKLSLAFSPPYASKSFACDVCNGGGSDHWLYRCGVCGFDAHLKCASAASRQAASSRSAPAPQPHGGGQHFATAPPPNPMMGGGAAFGVPAAGGIAMGMNGQNNLAFQAIMQMAQNNNAMAQAILAGGATGVGAGFGGDRGVQQMMQLMSGLNRVGGIPGLDVLGGGGGLDPLQSLLGGGGGGLGSLQSLLGGGGGGLDSLQSLLGGGGGGGLDFLGGLGGLL